MTILFAYDGSEGADAAIAAAGDLLGSQNPQAIVLTVWEPLVLEALRDGFLGAGREILVPNDSADDDRRAEAEARGLAAHGARLATAAGFDATSRAVADERNVAAAILAVADELGPELIVLGARGLTGIRALMGSVSNHVLQHASRPVMVMPARAVEKLNVAPAPRLAARLADSGGRG